MARIPRSSAVALGRDANVECRSDVETVATERSLGRQYSPRGSKSRTGDRVAFSGREPGQNRRIYILNLISGTLDCLTENLPGSHQGMCWSPDDSEMIVYAMNVPNERTNNPHDTISGIFKLSTAGKPMSNADWELLAENTFVGGPDWWRGLPGS